MLAKLLTVGLMGIVAATVLACGARPEQTTPAPQPPPAPSPAAPVATQQPPLTTPAAAPQPPSATPRATPSPAAPQPPPAAPLTDEQVLAQVDEMLRTGVLPPLTLAQPLLSDSATPVLWEDVPPGDLGSFNANLDFKFSIPPVTIQAPNVSAGR